ncbi:alginate O-acetyltransferase AlgX-related protein [Roseibium sp. M-1]
MSSTGSKIISASMIGMFAVGFAFTTSFAMFSDIDWKNNDGTPSAFLKGKVALDLENSYKDELFFRDISINLYNVVSLGLFGEAKKGALVGDDGWLYSTEEFSWTKDSPQNLKAALAAVETTNETFAQHGTKLVVALLPTKAEIYSEHLGSLRWPKVHHPLYDEVRGELQDHSVLTPELRAPLMDAKAKEQVFLKTDTHWTVEGAEVVARNLVPVTLAETLPSAELTMEPQKKTSHSGDLLKFVKLGSIMPSLAYPDETVQPILVRAAVGDVDSLLDESDEEPVPVALAGTSYSANTLWSFESHLRNTLQTDVLNVAEEGKGPFDPMSAYLKKLEDGELEYPKLVIWEMPIRYLDDYSPQALESLNFEVD